MRRREVIAGLGATAAWPLAALAQAAARTARVGFLSGAALNTMAPLHGASSTSCVRKAGRKERT